MVAFNVITLLESRLKAIISLRPKQNEKDCWRMNVQLYYDGEPAGGTRFTLRGYSQQEAEQIARNVKSNSFLMREIDEYLWGESD